MSGSTPTTGSEPRPPLVYSGFMSTNLALYAKYSGWEVDAPGIRLDDYEVCKLLGPLLFSTVWPIERSDLSVKRIEVCRDYIRSYPNSVEGSTLSWPTFIQKNMPKGLFDALVDISVGPTHPFPTSVERAKTAFKLGSNPGNTLVLCAGGGGGGGAAAASVPICAPSIGGNGSFFPE